MLAFLPPGADTRSHRCNGVAAGRHDRGTEPAVAPSLRMADQEARQGHLRQVEARRSSRHRPRARTCRAISPRHARSGRDHCLAAPGRRAARRRGRHVEAHGPRRGRGGGCPSRASGASERMDCRRHPLRTYVRSLVKPDVTARSRRPTSFWRRRSAVSSEAWWLWTASRSAVGRSHSPATTATRRASRSPRSATGSVAHRPPSRLTSTTHPMLTKDLRIARALTPCSARRTPSTAPPGTHLPTARRVGRRRRAGLPLPRAAAA